MDEGDRSSAPFHWPEWWPDDVDRGHVARWRRQASVFQGREIWGPRALVNDGEMMIGHVGFHLPPQPLDDALADPSFSGSRDPTPGGVVEIGYTVFPEHRGRRYATEAVALLVAWAFSTGEVTAILAAVASTNQASLAVLQHVGGFREVGRCVDSEGRQEIVLRRDAARSE